MEGHHAGAAKVSKSSDVERSLELSCRPVAHRVPSSEGAPEGTHYFDDGMSSSYSMKHVHVSALKVWCDGHGSRHAACR